jgi:hypothetical protein
VLRKEEVRRLLDGSLYQEKLIGCPVHKATTPESKDPDEKTPILDDETQAR